MDIVDLSQANEQDRLDRALATCRITTQGMEICQTQGCEESISAIRKRIGATRCLDCQTEAERRAKQWRGRAYD